MLHVLRGLFGALAMFCAGLFHHELPRGLCLMAVGLSFYYPVENRRQFIAMVLMGLSGGIMILGYQWWPILTTGSGLCLTLSSLDTRQGLTKSLLSFMPVSVGLSWCWISLPEVCIISGLLMAIMILLYGLTEVLEACYLE